MGENGSLMGTMDNNDIRKALEARDREWGVKIRRWALWTTLFFGLWVLKAWLNSGASDEFGNPGNQMSLFEAAHFVFAKTLDCALGIGIVVLACWTYEMIKSKRKKRS